MTLTLPVSEKQFGHQSEAPPRHILANITDLITVEGACEPHFVSHASSGPRIPGVAKARPQGASPKTARSTASEEGWLPWLPRVTVLEAHPFASNGSSPHSYATQVPPDHRTRLRTARRVWRTVILATQTPLTTVLPGPQRTMTGAMLSG